MNTALGNMIDITSTVKSAMVQANGVSNGSGAAVAQQTRSPRSISCSRCSTPRPATGICFPVGLPIAGRGDARSHSQRRRYAGGLKQLISERNQADLGVDGLGRLTISASGPSTVQVDEQATSFGFKLASATSTVTGATVTGPAGSPASVSVAFSAVPNPGETVTMRFNLPDGTSQNLTLTATKNSPPGANEFTIGATANQTAANFQAALTTSIGTLGATSLAAASAVAASNDFFNADANNPPQRVGGSPPFYGAAGMVPGTTANTVIWYTGETGSDPARSTATARIDPSLTVSYGARANEDAIRNLVQNVATLAAVTIAPTDPNGVALSSALNQRLTVNLGAPGQQTITDIETDIASAQTSMQAAKTRHQQATSSLNDFLQQIDGVRMKMWGRSFLRSRPGCRRRCKLRHCCRKSAWSITSSSALEDWPAYRSENNKAAAYAAAF